MHGETIKHVM